MARKRADMAPSAADTPPDPDFPETDYSGSETEAEASLLSINIGPRHARPPVPDTPGDGLIEAWTRARREDSGLVDTGEMRKTLGPIWETCFWVAYCPERERYIVTPIGRMPSDVSGYLQGPHDLAILVRWVNHIATRNCHSQDPVVSTNRLDFERGLADLELTLAPIDMETGVVTRYLGALGL